MSGKQSDINDIKLESVITVNAKGVSAKEVEELLLKNSSAVCNGYEVMAGDKTIAFVTDKALVDKVTSERLNSFTVDGAECESKFAEEISVKSAYFSSNELSNEEQLKAAVGKVDVLTTASTKKIYTVKYDTLTKKDSSKNAGYQTVIIKGLNGSSQTVTETSYINGEIVGEPIVSTVVLEYPINEVILVGTKNVYITSTPQNASASGFRWPLAVKGTITSYWGDGRDHKGVDIGVPQGTSIIAVKGGTVIEEGYRADYGYYVTIDHGNGVKTKYAHNKSNTVEVGQTVSAGQVIALSGNTGRSTGPHLHFEVIINGNRVNPAYYINLG